MFEALLDKARSIEGTAGLVIEDLKLGVREEFNADLVFPAAGLINLTILWELLRRSEMGHFVLDREVELLNTHKVGGSGILKDLHSGIRFSLENLALLMIVLSDNVATNILIDLLGVDAINETASALGLGNTRLERKMMDVVGQARGLDNFTSPADVALILKHCLNGPELSEVSRRKMLYILTRQQRNNKLPLGMPQGTVLAHKTGDLPGTEHDAGVLILPDRDITLVVMTRDLASNEEGIRLSNEVGKFLRAVYAM